MSPRPRRVSSTVTRPAATNRPSLEANVQFTFHENTVKTIAGIRCIRVEPDIDYYRDPAAHALLEVIPNTLSHGLTDPQVVYVLRWIAGRHAGVQEFDPGYVLVE